MNLRILLDQNVPQAVAAWLAEQRPGWRVRHVREAGLWGASDHEILRWAQSDGSIIVTFDEDFADTRMFPVGSHCGVIRLRVWPTTTERTEQALRMLLDLVPDHDLPGSLVIVDNLRIRVRKSIRHS